MVVNFARRIRAIIDITVNDARYDLTFNGDLTEEDFDLMKKWDYKNNSLMGEKDTLSTNKHEFQITVFLVELHINRGKWTN